MSESLRVAAEWIVHVYGDEKNQHPADALRRAIIRLEKALAAYDLRCPLCGGTEFEYFPRCLVCGEHLDPDEPMTIGHVSGCLCDDCVCERDRVVELGNRIEEGR